MEYYRIASALGGVRHGERDLVGDRPGDRSRSRKRIEALLAADRGDRSARARADSRPAAVDCRQPAPIAAGGLGLRPRARRPDWLAQASRFRGRASDARGPSTSTARRATRSSTPLTARAQGQDHRGLGRLDNLDQRGGGAISVQTRDGAIFDAIVFGEQEPGRWMAGSEGFARYQSASGTTENEAAIAAGPHGDQLMPTTARSASSATASPTALPTSRPGRLHFPAGETQVVFGLRHAPAGGNRMLAGYHRPRPALRPGARSVGGRRLAGTLSAIPSIRRPSSRPSPLELREERARLLVEIERGRDRR